MPDDIHARRVQSRQDLSVSQFGLRGITAARCVASVLPFSRHYRMISARVALNDVETRPSTAGMVVCPKTPKTGPIDLSLVFLILLWEGFMGLQAGLRRLPGGRRTRETPFEIRWRA